MTLKEVLIARDPLMFQVWAFYWWDIHVPVEVAEGVVKWGPLRAEETESDRIIEIKCWLIKLDLFEIPEGEKPREVRLTTTMHFGFVTVLQTEEHRNRLRGWRDIRISHEDQDTTARSKVATTEQYICPIDKTAARVTDFMRGEAE